MTRARLQLTDYVAEGRPRFDELERLSTPLSAVLTQELDGAATALDLSTDEILLAALGRAVERTIGSGVVGVDVACRLATSRPIRLACAAPVQLDVDELLADVHDQFYALADHRVVRGLSDATRTEPTADILFTTGDPAERPHLGHLLELRAVRRGDAVVLDWWFDARSFEAYTVAELADQLPLAMIELTSEATPPIHANHELALAH
ncbi:hypothetical protein H7K45_20005 [Mycobacterium yunnanensis]|uniref:Uncharacterized protein n=1 Tax=Mycobacterium yunnanensis TaxID=368477 RepID=A0A9X2Z3M8_9MYCO|nr:hypothetical protein [Mycobacterium yunnanensis]MCV7422838.1 hypothetical protein [Mycobacterium yunnanensis]